MLIAKKIKNSKFTEAMHQINHVFSVSPVTIRARIITVSKITLKLKELQGTNWRKKNSKTNLFFVTVSSFHDTAICV